MTNTYYEELAKELGTALATAYLMMFEMEKLKEENARYRKALEKYANPKTHSMDENGELWYGDYFDYKTARNALDGNE